MLRSFFTYDSLKIQIEKFNELRGLPSHISPLERLVCGGTAGLVAQSSTYARNAALSSCADHGRYPLDIMRRRMQTDGMLSSRTGYGHA